MSAPSIPSAPADLELIAHLKSKLQYAELRIRVLEERLRLLRIEKYGQRGVVAPLIRGVRFLHELFALVAIRFVSSMVRMDSHRYFSEELLQFRRRFESLPFGGGFPNGRLGLLGLRPSLGSSRTGLICALLFREPLGDLRVPVVKLGVEYSDLTEIQRFKCRKLGPQIRQE